MISTLKQVPFHNNNEQFNVQCVCIGETSFLSRCRWVECVLIILRLCHVIHYGVTAGWCIVVAIRRNWCLVVFSNKGNHYERLSLRASLVLPNLTHTVYIYVCSSTVQDTQRELLRRSPAKWTASNVQFASRMATTESGWTPCKYMFALATVPIFFYLFDMYYFM